MGKLIAMISLKMYIKKILHLLSFICFSFHVNIFCSFELWHIKIWVCKLLNYLSYKTLTIFDNILFKETAHAQLGDTILEIHGRLEKAVCGEKSVQVCCSHQLWVVFWFFHSIRNIYTSQLASCTFFIGNRNK